MSLTYRELGPEEFGLAPREVTGSDIFTPENSRILAAFNDDGEVVATWTLFVMAHIEPVWIREDYRGTTGVLRGLARNMKALLRDSGIKEVYTVVMESTPVLAKFARWFGAKQVDGALYNWKDTEA